MKILLHSCCAPCSLAIIDALQEARHELGVYFYNPNIHPYQEYKNRLDAWKQMAVVLKLPTIIDDDYALEDWLLNVAPQSSERCNYCYDVRMAAAAATAREHGYDAFTTSLLISPYQKHEKIIASAQKASEKEGIPFYYEDFRPLFHAGQNMAREVGLYMQNYCGCIYSEKERFCKLKKNLPAE